MIPDRLPHTMVRQRWVRVDEFPESKRVGANMMVTGECWHRVDERTDIEKKAARAAKAAMKVIDRAMRLERKLRGVRLSFLAPLRKRVFSNYLRAMARSEVLRPHSMQVTLVQDHPFLQTLDALPHVPRSVKAQYRKEVRLADAMTKEGWHVWEARERAEQAWEIYRSKMNTTDTPDQRGKAGA